LATTQFLFTLLLISILGFKNLYYFHFSLFKINKPLKIEFYETIIMYFIILTYFLVNFIMNVLLSNRRYIKFWLVPGFSSKKFRKFPKYYFSIEMKIKLKSTLYFDFCFVSRLIWSIEIAIEIRELHNVS